MWRTNTVCSQSCKMMPLCCLTILFLCLIAKAENTTVYRDSDEDVTFECSSAACPSSTGVYNGMYLYHNSTKREEVLYYHSKAGSPDKISPRKGYTNRIQTDGSLNKNTITIRNLTADDSGFYSCLYIKRANDKVQCNVHILFVRGVAPCPTSEEVPPPKVSEKNQPPVLIIVATCAISTLVIVITILLVALRVRKGCSSRRGTPGAQLVSNDYVYEVMTQVRPAAPEQSPPSPYALAVNCR